ncbi:hypothetical protein HYW42_05135 [Candidatus Daviesbacteria bacterium]|nr:hypothetical protein [Candidatus Daviesbacteria bacterium]
MLQKISVPVLVTCTFDPKVRKVYPEVVVWEGRSYPITKVGFHHMYRTGRTLFHVFSVESPSLFFRLVLNTDNLHWSLEEISDGESD